MDDKTHATWWCVQYKDDWKKAKNWLLECPGEPQFTAEMYHLLVNKKLVGNYRAYVQFKVTTPRWSVKAMFPGATYLEVFKAGYHRASSTVFERAALNDGPTVRHGGPPRRRGVPEQETCAQADKRRIRQDAICKKRRPEHTPTVVEQQFNKKLRILRAAGVSLPAPAAAAAAAAAAESSSDE